MDQSSQGLAGRGGQEPQSSKDLLKRTEKFQSKEALISQDLLALDFGLDRGGFARNQAGGRRRRSWDREKNALFRS